MDPHASADTTHNDLEEGLSLSMPSSNATPDGCTEDLAESDPGSSDARVLSPTMASRLSPVVCSRLTALLWKLLVFLRDADG